MTDQLLTVKQVAEKLNTKPVNVYAMCTKRKVEYSKIPGVGIRIKEDVINKLIESKSIKPLKKTA